MATRGPYLTTRFGGYFHRDIPEEDGRDSFLLELVVVFGAHPPEPFWVNK